MRKKIVLYSETDNGIGHSLLALYKVLAELSVSDDYDVYYLNKHSETDKAFEISSGIRFIEAADCDSSLLDDAFIITAAESFYSLLLKLRNAKNSRVVFFFNEYATFEKLTEQIDAGKEDGKKLAELLSSTQSCIFFDKRYMLYAEKSGVVGDKSVIVPFTLNRTEKEMSETAHSSETVEDFAPYVRIGWLGPITERAYICICRLLENLHKICLGAASKKEKAEAVLNAVRSEYYTGLSEYSESCELAVYNYHAAEMSEKILDILKKTGEPDAPSNEEKLKIEFHIIGLGKALWKTDFRKYSPDIRFVFAGPLDNEQSVRYIRENLDILVAYDMDALVGALSGIPVIIPISDQKKGKDNEFVYLFDTVGNALSWTNYQLKMLRYPVHTIEDVICDVCFLNNKAILGRKCLESAVNEYDSTDIAQKLTEMFNGSELLTAEKLLALEPVNKKLSGYAKPGKTAAPPAEDAASHIGVLRKLLGRFSENSIRRNFYNVQRSYKSKIKHLKKNRTEGQKIRTAFLVVFNSVFPNRAVFEKMLDDPAFDPYIIVVPNVSRTYQYLLDTFDEAYAALSEQYPGRTLKGYDEKTNEYYELGSEYNVVFFSNPYKNLVHPYHDIEYFLDKDVLTVYSNYGFAALNFWENVMALDFYNYLWKACIETEHNIRYLKAHGKIKDKNALLTGYMKMDKLAKATVREKDRKMILICPHHTVWGWSGLNISNFLKYSELFVELPQKYKELDFVFRPHPLLFPNLISHNIWNKAEIDSYLERLLQSENIIYDTDGDYFDTFANSDAMIHDCGSFIGEYLFTEKPCCYMMKSEEAVDKTLLPLGMECMEQYYHAFSEDDIFDFIENVVIKGTDPKKNDREKFSREVLKVNFPNSSEVVLNEIKSSILGKKYNEKEW